MRRFWAPVLAVALATAAAAQDPELDLPRPGAISVAELTGEAFVPAEGGRKPLKAEDRVRVGATVATGRRSMVTLHFSNGASVRLGADTELEIEEFGQAPATNAIKFAELKAEPTLSRTRLRLVKGDLAIEVRPLKVARGSSFIVTTPAGALRTGEATARVSTMMSSVGLGVCTLEVRRGTAEFELPGAAFQPVAAGTKLAFALERDRATGAIKVGEMPKPKGAK
ncbi:MAG: FecR domain-containing protein [Opitutaceae bacterium]|nr:FecR domain-containing protein [Opitutaceae bacterium]